MKLTRLFVLEAFLVVSSLCIVAFSPSLRAQSAGGQSATTKAATAQSPLGQSLEEMEAAGVKMSCNVTSVKLNKSGGPEHSNIRGYSAPPTGGLFSATNFPLWRYLAWAYDISGHEGAHLLNQLPKWATSDGFDIEAQARGNPTKAEMQLMLQSLLADRFKLVVHHETQQGSVFALVLSKPGDIGPQLQPHDGSCCGGGLGPLRASVPGRVRLGAQGLTVGQFAKYLPASNTWGTGVDRPVIDRTGLSGSFDFAIEFTPESFEWTNSPQFPGFQADPTGPMFPQALQDQLGFKLEPTTGPVAVLVIDHVEQPLAN
jgi:uncharacterized protein (TIGR03435 family)